MIGYLQSAHELRRWLEERKQLWWRLIIIASVLLFGTAYPHVKALQRYEQIILALPFIIAGALGILRWLPLGLIAIVGSLMIKYSGPSKLNATMVLVALLAVLWLVDMMVRQRKIQMVSTPVLRPLTYFVVVAILAFGAGQLPWYDYVSSAPTGAQLAGLTIYLLSAAAFLLVANLVLDQRWLEWMVWLFVSLGAMYIAGRVMGRSGRSITRLFPSGAVGSMFWAWLAAIAFSQALFNGQLAKYKRLLLGALVVALLYVGYFLDSGWKSGWIPPLVSVTAIVGLRSWRLGLGIAASGLVFVPDLLSRLISTDQYSYSTRVEAWVIVAEIAKVNPILGLGPSNYRWYTPLIPIRGYSVQFNSHNQYVDLVAQTGLLGLLCFLWIFWAVGLLAWRLRDRVPEGFPRAYVYGALGGIVATLVGAMLGDWVLPFFYNITLAGFRASVLPWLFMGGLVALERIYRMERKVDEGGG